MTINGISPRILFSAEEYMYMKAGFFGSCKEAASSQGNVWCFRTEVRIFFSRNAHEFPSLTMFLFPAERHLKDLDLPQKIKVACETRSEKPCHLLYRRTNGVFALPLGLSCGRWSSVRFFFLLLCLYQVFFFSFLIGDSRFSGESLHFMVTLCHSEFCLPRKLALKMMYTDWLYRYSMPNIPVCYWRWMALWYSIFCIRFLRIYCRFSLKRYCFILFFLFCVLQFSLFGLLLMRIVF